MSIFLIKNIKIKSNIFVKIKKKKEKEEYLVLKI
jgi:hypothetical protein